ncbi:Protein of unknown function [Lactobacillus acidophilus DSM 9126]|nr:Protein of unknown function [Lactobacillus acidophilus CIRM-BIA 442]CDF72171.1 Protein of unknown function [Lactobacillus acidophilus CIRM-BIA 445]CDF73993.1 Protein of unknown function [Lactobacillus acidophilus DSM 9126]CDF75999.1 Protein of unknown function [Lactobacillus acidophilus DSM 20242]
MIGFGILAIVCGL